MKATTLKLEDPLLGDLHRLCPPSKSLSAFVREILDRAIQTERMIQSAEKYAEFLARCPSEKAWLEEWETAPLEDESDLKGRET